MLWMSILSASGEKGGELSGRTDICTGSGISGSAMPGSGVGGSAGPVEGTTGAAIDAVSWELRDWSMTGGRALVTGVRSFWPCDSQSACASPAT